MTDFALHRKAGAEDDWHEARYSSPPDVETNPFSLEYLHVKRARYQEADILYLELYQSRAGSIYLNMQGCRQPGNRA